MRAWIFDYSSTSRQTHLRVSMYAPLQLTTRTSTDHESFQSKKKRNNKDVDFNDSNKYIKGSMLSYHLHSRLLVIATSSIMFIESDLVPPKGQLG